MTWSNRLPFLNLVILVILYIANTCLRVLPGVTSVVLRYRVDETKGGAAKYVLIVDRAGSGTLVSQRWELVPYDFGKVDYFESNETGLSPESETRGDLR